MDEKDVSKQQNVNEGPTNVEVESELIRFTRDREKPMTSIADMSINTNVITFKTVHSDSFRKETIKIRIFILSYK